jgi:hypothetical protein
MIHFFHLALTQGFIRLDKAHRGGVASAIWPDATRITAIPEEPPDPV